MGAKRFNVMQRSETNETRKTKRKVETHGSEVERTKKRYQIITLSCAEDGKKQAGLTISCRGGAGLTISLRKHCDKNATNEP